MRLPAHRGLAAAFSAGLEEALAMGADVIVNFDADLQYDPADIPALVAPILAGRADLVVGDRGPGLARALLAGQAAPPADRKLGRAPGLGHRGRRRGVSGFRALSREAARRVNVFSRMTYTLETLIQAGSKDLRVASVPVRRAPARAAVRASSRRSASTSSSRARTSCGSRRSTSRSRSSRRGRGDLPRSPASLLGARFLWFYFFGQNPGGHVQSLILAAVLIVVGFQTFLIALLADLVAINRRLLEEMKLRETEDGNGKTGIRQACDCRLASGPIPRPCATSPARPRARSGSPSWSPRRA